MEQHHTTEQDFQAKQLPWTNSGVERQTKNPTMDAFLLSIIFRDDFKNRWLQKMSNYKKYNATSTAIIALIRNRRIHQQQYNMISSTTSPAASTGASRIGL
jgi:hypothetical protein